VRANIPWTPGRKNRDRRVPEKVYR
jgi:hypothetical protein